MRTARIEPRERVPLAPYTTLELGGPARYLVAARSADELVAALAFADQRGLPATILGGGSNLVVADGGYHGVVVDLDLRGIELGRDGRVAAITAAAGEPWDEVVARSVAEDLAGLECLSGIPGRTGATPIQNVGAYGQEVSDTVTAVRVLERASGRTTTLGPDECDFGYRDSRFKRDRDRFVVLGVTFGLTPGGAPTVRYAELERRLGGPDARPTLAEVRATVLELRRGKSMVLDPADPNRRSVGSFFVNPLIAPAEAERVAERAVATGAIGDPGDVPRFPAGTGEVKLSAAWLIQHAGFERGLRRGPVGLSSNHTLALVHHGGGRTDDLLALAREIRDGVRERFGVTLHPEPVMLGFDRDPL